MKTINRFYMRRIYLLAMLLLAFTQVEAASVDLATAQATAQRFALGRPSNHQFQGNAPGAVKLIYTEVNSRHPQQAAYYIFNTECGFVVVAGDDRAQAVLAHGDRQLDMNRMPDNMRCWLSQYKRQLEFLQDRPDLVVDKPYHSQRLSPPTIQPLLTAEWDQAEPYWNHCPVYNGDTCLTGCPATSLSMVFYYWKYPTGPTPVVDSYINLGTSSRLPALPSTTFDWDNMLDQYIEGNYTDEQADAVAWLMRYIGQEEHMDYTPDGSGAQGSDILRTVKFFGYDDGAELVTKSFDDTFGNETVLISDADWAEMLLTELVEGRPVVYCAFDYKSDKGWTGHAFNVDGYDATDNTYHVNWGWSGVGNGNFALNAFSYAGYTFNLEQQMVIGIQPPVTTPTIRVSPFQVEMNAYVDQSATATINVMGLRLLDGVTLTLQDEAGVFSLDQTSITVDDAEEGKLVTVTYSPTASGQHTATIVLSSPDAEDVTVAVSGNAVLDVHTPELMTPEASDIGLTQFRASWLDATDAKYVSDYTLEVATKPGTTLVGEADWSNLVENTSNCAENWQPLMPEGWSFVGTGLWHENGGISINNKSQIVTPTYDLAGYEKVTVVVTAKSSMSQSSSKFTVSTGAQSVEFSAAGGAPFTPYVAVLDCNDLDRVAIAGKSNFPIFQSILVYAGELDEPTLRDVVEQGDADSRLITGITDKHYTVAGLNAGGTFYYRVMAHYIDGTQSPWSKSFIVTLAEGGHSMGDVDHNGSVDIADVSLLIDYLLSGDGDAVCPACADVDNSGIADIADVTALIDRLLIGQ